MRNSRVSPLENVIMAPPPSRTPPVAEPSDHTHVASAGRAASRSSAAFRLLSGPLEGSAFTRWSPWRLPCPCGERPGARNETPSSRRRHTTVDAPRHLVHVQRAGAARVQAARCRLRPISCRNRAEPLQLPVLIWCTWTAAVLSAPAIGGGNLSPITPCTSRSRPGRRQGSSASLSGRAILSQTGRRSVD